MLLSSLLGASIAYPLFLLLAALALEAVLPAALPGFRALPHPVRVIGAGIGWLDRKLNRDGRSAGDRFIRGLVTVLIVTGTCGAFGFLVTWSAKTFPFLYLLEFVILVSLLAQRSLYVHVRAVAQSLESAGLAAGREAVSHIVGRDVTALDGHGVARAAIESCAENFSDGVVAPTLWYAVLGLPGILVYKAANTLDSMIGHRSPRYLAFGKTAARLDDLLNLVPARLGGVFLVAAGAIQADADGGRAWRVMVRDAGKHRSPNAGWPEAAAAGALGLALGGPRRYGAEAVDGSWLGDGTAKASVRDIRQALDLYKGACAINALAVTIVAFLVVSI